ncbi:MAG: beta-N-acetylhexosaminidase [Gammaproteobacteria bacterium]|nr:beta-N-acetylhexosaminidase [Gammaproteobacteria bacterium]
MSHGPVMLDLQGCEITAEERELLRHPATGGVILFSRNFADPRQLQRLIGEIHALREPRLLVAVDQEGGRVQRFREGFTRLPPAAWLGSLYDTNQKRALDIATETGWLMASELLSEGVDFSFAPVLDIGTGISAVIGDRAFHPQAHAVSELAQAWMRGVHEAGMAAVGKHFPGHGAVQEDSHLELPVDGRRSDEILSQDLLPFRQLVAAGIEAIMPAHVIYSQVDGALAGFSRYWLQHILRGKLGFQGVIFSDDLSMAAAGEVGCAAERARSALVAGCDMVLVCNDRRAAIEVLEELKAHTNPAAQLRLVRMHGRHRRPREKLRMTQRWKQAVKLISAYECHPVLDLGL